MFFDLIGFNRTSLLDGPSKEEEFFREGGFPGIGVGYDAKSLSFLYLVYRAHAVFSGGAKVTLKLEVSS